MLRVSNMQHDIIDDHWVGDLSVIAEDKQVLSVGNGINLEGAKNLLP